jgi:hypothetical protein
MFSVLLQFGCNVDIRNKDGDTPLLLALDRKRFDPCFALITAGSDVREVGRRLGVTSGGEVDDSLEAEDHDQPLNQLKTLVQRLLFVEPRSLKNLCGFAIRRTLRSNFVVKSHNLPLPSALQSFVRDIFAPVHSQGDQK